MDIDYGLAIGDRCHIEGYAWGQALLRAAGVSFFCFTIFFFFWLCAVRHNFPRCSSSLFLPAFLLPSLHVPIYDLPAI